MAGGSLSQQEDEITGINVTPLVDIMLVLLIIFMVTSTYIANRSIEVQLPKAATAEDVATTNLAFVIDKEGQVFLDGDPVAWEAIPEQIVAYQEQEGTLQALLAADEGTPHGVVVKLIDLLRKNNIYDFAINVEPQ